MNLGNEILELLLAFGGDQGGRPGDIVVRFLLPSFFWTILTCVAIREWRRSGKSKDRFVGIAALIGLSRELLMFAAEYGAKRGFVDFGSIYPFYPPFEHAATMLSGIFIATAFSNYLLPWDLFSRIYFAAASSATLIIYGVTAAVWPAFLSEHPGAAFGSFWGDMAFRMTATILLGIILGAFLLVRHRGARVHPALLLGFLFLLLDELLMVVNLATAERHVAVFAPVRHNLHIWAIPLFLGVYWSELSHRLTRALHDIREERHLSQGIIAAIGDGISISNRDYRILYQNQIHKDMIGDHQGELCYKAYEKRDTICPDCPVERSMQDGKVHRGERSNLLPGGMRHIEITASPLRDAEGNIIAGIEVVRDVTERKRLTEEMAKTEKLESVGLLAGGLAHDFNNLLTGILGNISLAKMLAEGNRQICDHLQEAEKASLRASELTRQLLTFSKGGIPVKRTQSISGIVREAVAFTLSGSRVKAVFDLRDDLPPVEVDAGQMHQVFTNLTMNAVQAMPEGGIVTVIAAREQVEADTVAGLPPGLYVRVTMTDTGVGIPKDQLSKIFDPYFTTKETGTGLGLATVYSIVKKHGGSVTARSGTGSGAAFDVRLPLSPAQPVADTPARRKPASGSGSVLVMDDEQILLETAGQMLKALGYRADCARDGSEALSLYEAAQRANTPYSAVILDLTVPAGIGGKETMRRLLAIDPQATGIVSSGYSNDPVMANHLQHGFKAMLPKPYNTETLANVLRDVIGK